MIERLLIANRGEVAVRIIRACRELGIVAIAVYSDADAAALHVRLADEARHIGAAPPTDSYLRVGAIIAAAQASGATAVHPGFGFLSENAAFAQAVMDAGLTWVGPPPDAIAAMGDKTTARAVAEQAGVPIVPGYQPDAFDASAFATAAADMGYPVLVKASAGGGGKGMRVVETAADLADACAAAQREARNAFGDGRVFLEKYLPAARHVEIQILGDQHGHLVHLFERECSVQRRHQKIIEESPSPLLDDALRTTMGQAALKAARAIGYVNAGTVEFIVDAATRDFYFLEMNTRLQVEHPVTEMVTGHDLVHLQLLVADGKPLPFAQANLAQTGHAIECRIYAEDPANDFLPASGPVLLAQPPHGPGIRVDAAVVSGDTVTMHYDPMIAKLVVHAPSRPAALQRMRAALANYDVLGLTTNIPFLRDVVDHPDFVAGAVTTRWVEQQFATWQPATADNHRLALVAVALQQTLGVKPPRGEVAVDGDPYSPWLAGDAFRVGGAG